MGQTGNNLTAAERIQQWQASAGGGNLFIDRLRAKGFTEEQIADFLDVLDTICPQCFDEDRLNSTCWNDT